jgi:hypothetical protein
MIYKEVIWFAISPTEALELNATAQANAQELLHVLMASVKHLDLDRIVIMASTIIKILLEAAILHRT